MDLNYILIAITFTIIGFTLCAILSANKSGDEYITMEEVLKIKEEKEKETNSNEI